MANTLFDFDLGQTQGRLAPESFGAPAGSYVFCLGSSSTLRHSIAVGDYAQVSQSGSLSAYAYLHVTARLVPPRAQPPAGCYWWFSILIDGTEIVGHPIPDDRTRHLTDQGADVAELFGDHEIAFRLELKGAGGPYEVELPEVYVDEVSLDENEFSPLSVSGCTMWLRADLGVTTTGDLKRWLDLSGQLNHAAQTTAASRPELSGRAADFNGTSDALDLPLDTSVDGDYTIGVAVDYDSVGTTSTLYRQGAGSDGVHLTPTAGNMRQYHRGAGGTNLINWSGWTTGGQTWVVRHDGAGTADCQLDGVDKTPQSLSNNITPTTSACLGAWSTTSQWVDGKIYGVIVYSSRKADSVVAKITAYLTALRTGADPPDSWRPTDESGLVLWLERADRNAGAAMTDWADQSTTGRNVTQGSASYQPVLIPAGGPNDLPFVHFDKASYLRGVWSQAQPVYTAVEVMPSESSTDLVTVFDGNNSVANSGRLFTALSATAIRLNAGASLTKTCSPDEWHSVEALADSTSSIVCVDGGADAAGDAGSQDPDGITIGASGVATAAGDCRIAEVVQYNRAPTTDERTAIRGYLDNRYGG